MTITNRSTAVDVQAAGVGHGDPGVDPEALRDWGRAAGVSRPRERRAETPAEPPTPLKAENAALREKARELEEEREILRKAATYVAGETRG